MDSLRTRLAERMAVPKRPAELVLTALRPKNAPRIAVPKEIAV